MALLELDIGCGSKKKSGCLGVDVRKSLGSVDIVASATNLPFQMCSIDAVYSRRCLQHIVDEEKAINEVQYVLKVHGNVKIIVASYRGWLFYHVKNILRKKPYPIFHFYSDNGLKQKMESSGFENIKISHVKTRLFGYDIVCECSKIKNHNN